MTDQVVAAAPVPGRRGWRGFGTGPGSARPRRAGGARRTSWLGFVLALPPVAFIALFAGLPIALAFAFTLGYGGGLNEITALIGQDVYLADGPPGTVEPYRVVFANGRFREDLIVTILSRCCRR